MARVLTASMLAAVSAATVRPALLAQVGSSDGDVLAWTGNGVLSWDGKDFQGVGTLGGITSVTESGDLEANGITLQMSGIPQEMISYAIGAARQGLPAKLWLAAFAADMTLIADPLLVFSGLTDVPEIEEGGDTATIKISAESRLIRMETPQVRRYTPEDQHLDDPTDEGFDYVAGLQEKEFKFGRA